MGYGRRHARRRKTRRRAALLAGDEDTAENFGYLLVCVMVSIGFARYWAFATPLMAATTCTGTWAATTFVLVWLIVPPVLAWKISHRRRAV